MKTIYQWPIDYGEPVTLKSNFTLEESIARLQKEVSNSWSTVFYEAAIIRKPQNSKLVGKVSKERVHLFCARQGVFHAGRPHFFGSFKEVSGNIVLEGRFDVSWWLKLGFWIALPILPLLILSTVFGVFEETDSIKEKIALPLVLLGIYLFSVLMRKFTQQYVSDDMKWIVERIKQALQH